MWLAMIVSDWITARDKQYPRGSRGHYTQEARRGGWGEVASWTRGNKFCNIWKLQKPTIFVCNRSGIRYLTRSVTFFSPRCFPRTLTVLQTSQTRLQPRFRSIFVRTRGRKYQSKLLYHIGSTPPPHPAWSRVQFISEGNVRTGKKVVFYISYPHFTFFCNRREQ